MGLFVPVNDSEEARKELLSGMRDVIDVLRKYEAFRKVRSQKAAAIHEFVQEWQDLSRIMKKLKTVMPKVDVPKVQVHEAPAPKPHQASAQKEAKTSKMDHLEAQLASIEKRLSALNNS